MRIIDADGHVAEGASLAVEAMRRWPEYIVPRADGRALVIEGRNYTEADGPGAGYPREHGLSTAPGIDYSTPEGVSSLQCVSMPPRRAPSTSSTR